jgi:hypothetical protein
VLLFQKLPERLKMSEANNAPKDAQRPWFKKKRFWVIGVLAIVLIMQQTGNSGSTDADNSASETTTEAPAEATPVTAKQLLSELEENPLGAKTSWDGKLVTITGIVDNIDASGDYFSLSAGELTFIGIMVYIDDSFVDAVSAFKKGQEVTVTGTISDVGELMGYSVDAVSIP